MAATRGDRHHRRRVAAPGVTLLAFIVAAFAPAGVGAHERRAEPEGSHVEPKVAVIVGPVGDNSDNFRAVGDEAVREALKYTPNVVKVYTPNATWRAAKAAMQGASVVVYAGHGNGWPSKYRDHLYPPTQNGLGLNPVAGGDDEAHQYFGEAYLEREIELAPNAVVLLHRLCYASGNTEPGLPEGTTEESKQRVDNFAAGFLAAGARAVVAEGHFGPGYYINELFDGERSIEEIWRRSPSFHGNVFAFESKRSPGFVAQLDPDRGGTDPSGFYRSLVSKPALGAREVLAGSASTASRPGSAAARTEEVLPPPPSLAEQGFEFEAPTLEGTIASAADAEVTLPVNVPDDQELPESLTVGVRWDPVDLDQVPTARPVRPDAARARQTAAGRPVAGRETYKVKRGDMLITIAKRFDTTAETLMVLNGIEDARKLRTGTVLKLPYTNPLAPSEVALIQPETLGSLVEPVPAERVARGLRATVTLPERSGLYRVVTTLHDADGLALDADTQAAIPGLLVRVAAAASATYSFVNDLSLAPGEALGLPVLLRNSGTVDWRHDPNVTAEGANATARVGRSNSGQAEPDAAAAKPVAPPRLVGHWVALTPGAAVTGADPSVRAVVKPGTAKIVELKIAAPSQPGTYALLLDVVTPDLGSLASRGVEPGFVRVTVRPDQRARPSTSPVPPSSSTPQDPALPGD